MKTWFWVIALAVAMFLAGRGCGRGGGIPAPEVRADTVWVRDTVRDTVPVPVERRVVRIDTVWVGTPTADSEVRDAGECIRDTVRVTLPIEQKIYATDHYRAVVEGFRPRLTAIDLYRTTAHITAQPRRLGIGIQAGWGITPKGPQPYLGVGLQYRLGTQ